MQINFKPLTTLIQLLTTFKFHLHSQTRTNIYLRHHIRTRTKLITESRNAHAAFCHSLIKPERSYSSSSRCFCLPFVSCSSFADVFCDRSVTTITQLENSIYTSPLVNEKFVYARSSVFDQKELFLELFPLQLKTLRCKDFQLLFKEN